MPDSWRAKFRCRHSSWKLEIQGTRDGEGRQRKPRRGGAKAWDETWDRLQTRMSQLGRRKGKAPVARLGRAAGAQFGICVSGSDATWHVRSQQPSDRKIPLP